MILKIKKKNKYIQKRKLKKNYSKSKINFFKETMMIGIKKLN